MVSARPRLGIMATVTEHRPRRTVPADAAALTGLRAAMFAAMGTDPGPDDAGWRAGAAEWFAQRMTDGDRFAAFVMDVDGRPVSSAAVEHERHAPSPASPGGVRAKLFNVCTLPSHQGRGYARACVTAALAWVRHETTAEVVQLSATPDGIALYRSLGFTVTDHPAMRLPVQR